MTRPVLRGTMLVLVIASLVIVALYLGIDRNPAGHSTRLTLGTPAPARIELELVASGYERLTAAVDTDLGLMVTEQVGRVMLVGRDGSVLDIRDEVQVGIEEGMLGLAVRDGRLFVLYTAHGSVSTLARYDLTDGRASNPVTLLTLQQP